ncbi:peptidoglycan/xylan/chitin deacetylase (PgdA/CDA1 family) [Paenibacillus turicensis]|uniref:Peptidoglycan/xylan/chitin deacetylase (PgdA/CDA1 family) n=1 Tax=Paenibacillus turicensis TaxID=160487 RepID=A0ABS4FUC6_9BACL|nr:polysaccharide deacetylase [Paenibacillus turicensis]MBP1906144.1 peptidoglycan/xylan/chitin deacetylase (PgdA/CDA1 family) [Paenibacillus turicensis]
MNKNMNKQSKSLIVKSVIVMIMAILVFSTQADKLFAKAQAASHTKSTPKIVYLTFDDGPSKLTPDVLTILAQHKIQATFFVLGSQAKTSPEVIRQIADGGHVIGNHTYNHNYSELYKHFGQFWKQIKQTEEIVREITDKRPALLRAPGGTYGHFNKQTFSLLAQAGYKVFDWDVDSGDSKRRGVPATEIIKNITSSKLKNEIVVLMHDGAGHQETVKALPAIIKYYKQQGYSFGTLNAGMKPVQFTVSSTQKYSDSTSPTQEWITRNIIPNAALFTTSNPLHVEAGGIQTKLAAGEYEFEGGRYQVPIRAMMERLGGEVMWDSGTKTVTVMWGDSKLTLYPEQGSLVAESHNKGRVTYSTTVDNKNDTHWVSLRVLLAASGHDIKSVKVNPQETIVKAF